MKKPKRFYPEEFELKEDRRRAPVITEEIKEIRERAPIIEDRDPEEFEYNLKMKKGGMTKGQKKVGKVMSEFKAGKLKSSSGKKVTNPKQAIAIGLSEAGMSKKKKMGGGMMNDNSSQYSHGGMSKKKIKTKKLVYGGVTSPVADGTQAYSSFAQQAPVMEAPAMDVGMSDPMSGYKDGGSINVGKGKDYIKDLL